MTEEEVKKAQVSIIQRYRIGHHMVALYFAAGMTQLEIEKRTGFTRRRLALLYDDPTFQELISYYARQSHEGITELAEEYNELRAHNALAAQRMIKDRLDQADEPNGVPLPVRELIAISNDGSKTINHNHKHTFDVADALDRAILRSGKKDRMQELKLVEKPKALPVLDLKPITTHSPVIRQAAPLPSRMEFPKPKVA